MRNRISYPEGTSFTNSLSSHTHVRPRKLVDPRRVELPFPLCKSGVLPLNDGPVVAGVRIGLTASWL
jgi:hypothetical protein